MPSRALLIGSQTGGLTGVHADVEVMADALASHGFVTRSVTGPEATTDGIVAAYRDLIADTATDDAAAVYYSGHGARVRNAMRARDPSQPAWLQYLVPTDIDDRTDGRFGGLLAEELSALQWQLTDRTANVTTVLDCCHSARMSRNPAVIPKSNDRFGFPWDAVAARWEQSRGRSGSGDVNPSVVHVVACEPDQSAYEIADSSLGGTHGALTAALVTVLRRGDATSLNWSEVIEIVRPSVLDLLPAQRPDLLGSRQAGSRLLFSLTEKDTTGVLRIVVDGGAAWVGQASLFGVAEGDSYAVVAAGGDVRAPLATALVDLVVGERARLILDGLAVTDLPPGAFAHPVAVSFGRRPVAVVPVDDPAGDGLRAAVRASATVRLVDDGGPAALLATVRVDDRGLELLDAGGSPLANEPTPATAGGTARVVDSLHTLARATHVRELISGTAGAALAEDVEITYTRLDPTTGAEIPLAQGEHLFDRDAIVVRATNNAPANRYVTVIDIGLSGAVTLITSAQPSGTTVAAGETVVIGEGPDHVVRGIELFWPPGLPTDGPRPETMLTLVADAPIDGLARLAQSGIATRSGARSSRPMSAVERLIDDLSVGRRDARPPTGPSPPTRYCVRRLDIVLHPITRPPAGEEPLFEVDERPDPTFRLVVPRGAKPPEHVSVRIADLVVHSNRALLAAKVRVDFLVVTAPVDGDVVPFRAETAFFDRVRDGDRLPFDHLLVYDGPVSRFLDLAVWVSKADQREVHLAELLHAELGDDAVAGAVTSLAGLAVAAPAAAAIAGSAAAVATLVRTGARLLDAITGTSIGVYRTSLLAHERFGAGEPAQRHPTAGSIRAQDMSLAYEVVDAATSTMATSNVATSNVATSNVEGDC